VSARTTIRARSNSASRPAAATRAAPATSTRRASTTSASRTSTRRSPTSRASPGSASRTPTAQLIGSKLRFDTPDGVIKVEIAGFSAASGLAPGLPDIPTYALKYGPADASPGELHSVCPSYALTPDEAVVTLIRGETYDRQTNEVHESPGWMSLACADEAVYKMMRLGYGPHSDFAGTGSPATLEQRQATIRMITADYCGTGHSFTQPNTPLVWTNVGGSVVGDGGGTPLTLEAYWNRSGAICLDTTRLPLEGLDKVTNYCDIPPCSLVNTEQIEYEWVTEVPL
jgi:hypothetical protein